MKDDAFTVLSMLVELEASSGAIPESHEIAVSCQMRQQDVEDILEELESTGHVQLPTLLIVVPPLPLAKAVAA